MADIRSNKEIEQLFEELQFAVLPSFQKQFKKCNPKKEAESKFKDSFDRLEDCIDYFRVVIKYQQFDLDATAREKNYLKKIIENKEK